MCVCACVFTTLTYKGVDVRVVNTTRNIPPSRLNEDTPEGKEFDSFIKKLFKKTNKIIEESSEETNTPEETVRNIVNVNEYPTYTPFSFDQAREMLKERAMMVVIIVMSYQLYRMTS